MPPMLTILDGPLGTLLDARGVANDAQSWSAAAIDTAPEIIEAIHRDYAAAGATVHTANTFRTKRRNVGDDWRRLTDDAVAIARRSVPAGHRIAGSIAPLEDCYRPDLSPTDDSRSEHQELADALAATGVDLLLCETFANIHEAMVAVKAAVWTGVATWLALTAAPEADLLTASEMATGARRAVDAGATAVLVNCTPYDQTLKFVEALAGAKLGVPIGAYANAGTETWQSSEERHVRSYAEQAFQWIDAGATIIGGCCGTTPAHIAALSPNSPMWNESLAE